MDTQDKRASVIGLGLAALLVLPAPGTLDQPDRQQAAYCYRGIVASAPSATVAIALPDGTAHYLTALATGTAHWQTTSTGTAHWQATLPTNTAEWGT